jgi:DNA-binding transcriptional MerR regulator
VKAIDISEVARRSGVPASTLRYYEERGLIESIGRRGLRRLFTVDVLDTLGLIGLGRSAGLSLDDIGRMVGGGRPRIDRGVLAAKADELDHRIRQLTTMRDGLRHAAECPAPSHMECPKFRRIVKLSSAAALRRRDQRRTSGAAAP